MATLLLTLLYIAASLMLVPSSEPPIFNFREGGSVTALSATLLGASAAFAFASAYFATTGRHRILWIVLFAALGFLALDELLQFHDTPSQRFQRPA